MTGGTLVVELLLAVGLGCRCEDRRHKLLARWDVEVHAEAVCMQDQKRKLEARQVERAHIVGCYLHGVWQTLLGLVDRKT